MTALTAFSRGDWDRLRRISDEEGMAAAAAVLGAPDASGNAPSQAQSWAYLRDIDKWDTAGDVPSPDLPEPVKILLRDSQLPEWIAQLPDLDGIMKRSCALFDEYAVEFVLALLCKSLPECYSAGRGADVLAYTGQLGGPVRDHPGADIGMARRVMETAVFIRHVMTHANWENSVVALRTIQKIRMFHCGIRTMILRNAENGHRPWDIEHLGLPINQMDMAGTLLAFSLQACRGARELGVPISAHQEREYMTHWLVIGHHLGIDDEILHAIHKHPGKVWDDIATMEFTLTPSRSGIVLTDALKGFLEEHVFEHIRFLHVSQLLMEDLMEPRAKRVVLTARVSRHNAIWLEHLIAHVMRIAHKVMLAIPGVRHRTIQRLGEMLIDKTIQRWAGPRTAEITIENELMGMRNA
jgi:hypothetical protein